MDLNKVLPTYSGSRHAPLRTARQSGWLLSCDWHFVRPLRPTARFFYRAPLRRRGGPTSEDTSEREARTSARMRRQGGAERTPRREDYGWGWAGGFKQSPPDVLRVKASAPRTARQSWWLLSCDWHYVRPLGPTARFFSEPLLVERGPTSERVSERDARTSAPAAPPRRSAANAAEGGLRWGWVGGI